MLINLEIVAKIIALIAIPFVLWWLGKQYQSADSRNKTAVEYVKLSIDIISNKNEADPQLLEWATETLNYYSQIKFGEQLKQAVASGEANISPSVATRGWFAVIGSLESKSEAIQLIDLLKASKPESLESFEFELYNTKAGHLYALIVGSEASKADAIKRAKLARETGWVSDAYAQRNKGWIREEI